MPRSFEFKIGADTSDFIKKIDKASKSANTLEKQASNLEKGLELKFDDTRFLEAQKRVKEALEINEKQADALNKQLRYLEESGQIDTDNYDKIKSKLAEVENKALLLRNHLKEINELKFTKLSDSFNKVGSSFTSAGKALSGLSIASGAALAGLTKLGTEAIKQGDEISTLASKYNMSAKEIQKWQYVAMQSDVEDTTLYKGITKLNVALADLSVGATSTAATALTELGLDASASFEDVVKILSQFEDASVKAYYANQIFGDKLGTEVIPLLNQGADAIQSYINEFEEVGYMSDEAVSAMSQFDNVMNKLKETFKQLGLQVGTALLPVFQSFANFLNEKVVPRIQSLVDKFSSLRDSTKNFIIAGLALVTALSPVLLFIGKMSSGIGSIISLIPKLSSALSLLSAHPIIAIIGVIAGILLMLYTRVESFREAINKLVKSLSSTLQPVLTIIGDLITSLTEVLSPLFEILTLIVNTVLVPVIDNLTSIIDLISQFLLPVINAISNLIKPLISLVTGPLINAFKLFGKLLVDIFSIIPKVINPILGFIEKIVNGVIDFINNIIRGINKIGSVLGFTIGELDNVKLQIETNSDLSSSDSTPVEKPNSATSSDVLASARSYGGQTTVNNDYSNKDITINVTIQNYGDEVDVDSLIEKINIGLAAQM